MRRSFRVRAFMGAAASFMIALTSLAGQSPFLGPNQTLDETIKRGEYLAYAGDCIACHTKHDGAPFAGGLPMVTPFGTLYSPNITPDIQNGIGNWSADDFTGCSTADVLAMGSSFILPCRFRRTRG